MYFNPNLRLADKRRQSAPISLTEKFRSALLAAVRRHDCVLGRKTSFGQRYIVDFPVTRADKRAQVSRVWNVRLGENVPRLVTCYVL